MSIPMIFLIVYIVSFILAWFMFREGAKKGEELENEYIYVIVFPIMNSAFILVYTYYTIKDKLEDLTDRFKSKLDIYKFLRVERKDV